MKMYYNSRGMNSFSIILRDFRKSLFDIWSCNNEEIQLYEISGEKFSNNLTIWENTGFAYDIKRNALFYENKGRYSKSIIYYKSKLHTI